MLLLSLVAMLLIICAQLCLGSSLWFCLRRGSEAPLLEIVGMGLVLGPVLSVLTQQLALWFLPSPNMLLFAQFSWVLLLPVVVVLLVRSRGSLVPISRPDRWQIAAFGVTALTGLALVGPSILRTQQAIAAVDAYGFNADLVFLEALGQSVSRYGITDSVFLADFGVRYHWLVYAWSGLVTQAAQAPPFLILTVVVPLVLTIAASALAVTWARKLSTVRWVPLLAGVLTVVGAYVGAQQGVTLVYDSPSNGMGSVVLLGAALLMTLLFRQEVAWPALMVAALFGFAAMAAKASHGAVLMVGSLAVALAACWLPRSQRWRMWAFAVCTGISGLVAYLVLLSGIAAGTGQIGISSGRPHASTWQGLDPASGQFGIAAGTAVLILAILPRWIGVFSLVRLRQRWHEPELPFGLGAGLVGIGALVALSSGVNDAWFAVAATTVLSVLSAVGIGVMAHGRGPRFWGAAGVIALLAGSAVFVAFGLATVSQTSTLWRGPLIAWLTCLVGAFLAVLWTRRHRGARSWISDWWTAAATSLVFASVLGRVTGPVLWDMVGVRAAPIMHNLIRLQYPAATFDASATRPAVDDTQFTDDTPLMKAIGRYRGFYESVAWTPGRAEAAMWVRQNVPSGDLMATDNPIQQAYLPAITGNRLLVSGMPYVLGYAPAEALPTLLDRLALVEDFVSQPTETTLAALLDRGVEWIWLEDSASRKQDFTGLSRIRVAYANDEVTVLDLR